MVKNKTSDYNFAFYQFEKNEVQNTTHVITITKINTAAPKKI